MIKVKFAYYFELICHVKRTLFFCWYVDVWQEISILLNLTKNEKHMKKSGNLKKMKFYYYI